MKKYTKSQLESVVQDMGYTRKEQCLAEQCLAAEAELKQVKNLLRKALDVAELEQYVKPLTEGSTKGARKGPCTKPRPAGDPPSGKPRRRWFD